MGKHEITYDGETRTLAEWARELNIKQSTLRYRIKTLGVDGAMRKTYSEQGSRTGLDQCCYPDCFSCPYPDCMTDDVFPGELKRNAEWSGLPQILLSDTRLRMFSKELSDGQIYGSSEYDAEACGENTDGETE